MIRKTFTPPAPESLLTTTIYVVQSAPHAQRGHQGCTRRRRHHQPRGPDVESVRISQKQINDFVTEVDHAAEKSSSKPCSQPTQATASWLKSRAKSTAPSIPISSGSSTHWTAPPTSSTASLYCVSIALTVKGKVEQAVVYDPPQRPVHRHQRGRGAFLNERRIRAKRTPAQDCLISTGFPFRPGDNFPAT